MERAESNLRGRAGLRAVGGSVLTLLAVTAARLLGGPHWGDDAVVLAVFVHLTGAGLRSSLALVSILAFVLAFPPFAWPLYGICLAPVAWLWREARPERQDWMRESFGVGFAMCWLSMPFVRADFPTFGTCIQGLASTLFGLQMLVIATALRWSRTRPLLLSVPLVATVATGCEIARVVGLGWPLLGIGFPAASTPLAQWAYYLGPFGVSFLVYTTNLLCLPLGPSLSNPRAWIAPACALALGVLAWFGGAIIAGGVRVEPVPISALLVQPNRVVGASAENAGPSGVGPVARLLERLTRTALEEGPPVDLIVWPECAIGRVDEDQDPSNAQGTQAGSERPSPAEWLHRLASETRTSFLAGAMIRARDGHRFNSALLVSPAGEEQRYDKRVLVVGAESMYTPGGSYHPLLLRTGDGRAIRLGISICYEMHFPGLPQYSPANRPDLMVHLNNESMYRRYRGQQGHGTWAIQYRAIETRTWQLVCATWTRSALIDPRGRIRAILDSRPGTIRVPPEPDP